MTTQNPLLQSCYIVCYAGVWHIAIKLLAGAYHHLSDLTSLHPVAMTNLAHSLLGPLFAACIYI